LGNSCSEKRGQATFSVRKKTETNRGQKIRKSSLSPFFNAIGDAYIDRLEIVIKLLKN
jgi:hypothetical protein